jgi:hypothetical protein
MSGLRALNPISSNIIRPEKLMNPVTAAGSLQGSEPSIRNPVRRTRLRSSRHYCRARRLWSLRAATDAATARDRRGLAGSAVLRGRGRNRFAWFFCHFFIAFCAATIYFTTTRWVTFLLEHAATSGLLNGVAVYFFMNRVVVPLSGATANASTSSATRATTYFPPTLKGTTKISA